MMALLLATVLQALLRISPSVRAELIAACVEGPASRIVDNALHSIRENVLIPLQADLFVVSPYKLAETNADEVQQRLSPLGHPLDSFIEPDWSQRDMHDFFWRNVKKMQHDVDFWQNFDGDLIKRRGGVLPSREQPSDRINTSSYFSAGLWNVMGKRSCYEIIANYENVHGILLKKNLANKNFGYLARCEFWLKIRW